MNRIYHHIPTPSFTGKVYLSGVNGLDYCEELGINYIVSLFPALQNQTIPSHISRDVYSIADMPDFQSQLKMNAALDEIRLKMFEVLQNGGNVLVHCFAGISRSATAVVDFICTFEKTVIDPTRPVGSAIEYVRSYRQQIAPNMGFQIVLMSRHTPSV